MSRNLFYTQQHVRQGSVLLLKSPINKAAMSNLEYGISIYAKEISNIIVQGGTYLTVEPSPTGFK